MLLLSNTDLKNGGDRWTQIIQNPKWYKSQDSLYLTPASLKLGVQIWEKIMNQETVPTPSENTNPEEKSSPLNPELLDKIKHPPKMDDVIRAQSPEERRSNPALVPEMLDEPTDDMIGFTRE